MAVEPSEPADGFGEDFVRDAAFTEPSARERARKPGPLKRARERRSERRSEKRRRRAMVDHWRAPEYRARGRAKVIARVLAGVLAVAVAAVAVWQVRGGTLRNPAGPAADDAIRTVSVDAPFEGSPAESYAVGEVGIEFPKAKAMNGLSAQEMSLAFMQVRKMLIAANLDRDAVFKGKPDALAKVLVPEQRRDLLKNLRSRDEKKNTRVWLTSFAPGSADPTGTVIKVRGTTKVRKASQNGLRGAMVELDYNFVYAVHRPGRPDTTMRVVVRRTSEVFVHRTPSGVESWLYWSTRSPAPARCDTTDGYVHPIYDDENPAGQEPSGAPIDPYDLSREQKTGKGCETVTRT